MSYVIRVLGVAGPTADLDLPRGPCFIQRFDLEAFDGRGSVTWTQRAENAKRFASAQEAIEYYYQESTTRPRRVDGKPNRPMTALTVAIEELPLDG